MFVTLYFNVVYELVVIHVVIISAYTVWTILKTCCYCLFVNCVLEILQLEHEFSC
jgi:hypothetical protein